MKNRLERIKQETPTTANEIECLINMIASHTHSNSRLDFDIATKINLLNKELREILK